MRISAIIERKSDLSVFVHGNCLLHTLIINYHNIYNSIFYISLKFHISYIKIQIHFYHRIKIISLNIYPEYGDISKSSLATDLILMPLIVFRLVCLILMDFIPKWRHISTIFIFRSSPTLAPKRRRWCKI